jgi:putative transposase
MPRHPRAAPGGYCYHVLNRGNSRRTVFHKDGDFAAFIKLLRQAGERTPVRLLAYCLIRQKPNTGMAISTQAWARALKKAW